MSGSFQRSTFPLFHTLKRFSFNLCNEWKASCLRVMVKNESVHATSGLDYFNALLSASEKTFAPLLWLLIKLQTEFISLHKQNSKALYYHIIPTQCFTRTLQDHLRFQASGARTWRSSPHSPTPSLGSQFNMVSIPSDDLEPVTLICCYRLRLLFLHSSRQVFICHYCTLTLTFATSFLYS